jgi:Sugar phosphate isomerases/epimerases
MKRREFIQTSAMAAVAALALPSFSLVDKKKIGLQLYSLRDVIKTDPKGVMKKVAEFGYNHVETFDYSDGMLYGMKTKEFGEYCKSLGIKITSGHYGMGFSNPGKKGTLTNDWERAVNDAKEMGQEYMNVAWLDPTERKSLDDYKRVCEVTNKAAEVCKKYGIQMGYHNHDFEFTKIDGQVPYDMMLSLLDKKLVTMELDLYWTNYSDVNPLDYFAKYPGRFHQWHVKDRDKTDPNKDKTKQVDVGTGRVDFKSIFAKAKQSGLKYFYIEQEHYPVSSMESVKQSILNFKKLI